MPLPRLRLSAAYSQSSAAPTTPIPGGQLARNSNRALVAQRFQHVDHRLLHGALPAT